METQANNVWKKCSTCKKEILFGSKYFVCSVSTCNGQRTGYVFCRMQCFESHLPGARHRDAGAIEMLAPKQGSAGSFSSPPPSSGSAPQPQRIIVRPTSAPSGSQPAHLPQEVLVIASRLKDYIAARSEFNTSAAVMDILSHHLRILCDQAIENAKMEGRKTVLDRDFDFLKVGK